MILALICRVGPGKRIREVETKHQVRLDDGDERLHVQINSKARIECVIQAQGVALAPCGSRTVVMMRFHLLHGGIIHLNGRCSARAFQNEVRTHGSLFFHGYANDRHVISLLPQLGIGEGAGLQTACRDRSGQFVVLIRSEGILRRVRKSPTHFKVCISSCVVILKFNPRIEVHTGAIRLGLVHIGHINIDLRTGLNDGLHIFGGHVDTLLHIGDFGVGALVIDTEGDGMLPMSNLVAVEILMLQLEGDDAGLVVAGSLEDMELGAGGSRSAG